MRNLSLAILVCVAQPAFAALPADVGLAQGYHAVVGKGPQQRRLVLTHFLGHGAFSETYRAHDVASGAEVAVKIPRVVGKGARTAIEGFRHEQDVLSRARAPQLPASYGIGHLDGWETPALVLELARGEQLGKSAWARDWSVPKAVRVTMQILRGLRALHRADLRHNDLHLGNIMIEGRRSDSVKVIDVGNATNRQDEMRGWENATMAPERPAGQRVPSHGRVNADVYSAAATLAVLLTGKNPRKEPGEVLAALPDVKVKSGRGFVRLRDVIARGLEPNPARRYQTAQELIDALRPFGEVLN